MSITSEVVTNQIAAIKRERAEMAAELEYVKGNPIDSRGRPYTAKRKADAIRGLTEQVAAYDAMIAALSDILAGKPEHMSDRTRRSAKRFLAEAQRLGYGDDSTVEHLATGFAIDEGMRGQAAMDLAYAIVHRLKCKLD